MSALAKANSMIFKLIRHQQALTSFAKFTRQMTDLLIHLALGMKYTQITDLQKTIR